MNKKIFIFGSCVSRDIFNLPAAHSCQVIQYLARSSIASAFQLQPIDDKYSRNLASPFQRKLVGYDLEKSATSMLNANEFDVLLIDFIDERFDLFSFANGSLCTLSSELLNSGFQPPTEEGRIIKSGSDEFYELWEAGWRSFVEAIKRKNLMQRIRLNKVFWGKKIEDGSSFPNCAAIDAANAFLARLYKRAEMDLHPEQVMQFRDELMVGAKNHRWGISPFHYVDAYYQEALNHIYGISYAAWGESIYEYSSVASLINAHGWPDGVHRAMVGSKSIDFLIHGLSTASSGKLCQKVLVGLNGAVVDRKTKLGPFFSGIGLASALKSPLIAIADTTVTYEESIGLAWYAGSADIPNMPAEIGKVLDAISNKTGCEFIFFGGSGGGFGILSILSHLHSKAKALIWNPQTSIANYREESVRDYLQTAFPAIWQQSTEFNVENRIQSCLDSSGIVHDLTKWQAPDDISLLYLQNISDWHMQKHAAPFMEDGIWQRINGNSFACHDRRITCWLGNWGEGHIAPPHQIVRNIIEGLIENVSITDIAHRLSRNSEYNPPAVSWFKSDAITDFSISTRKTNGSLQVSAKVVDSATSRGKYEYAYYLYVGGVRTSIHWYTSEALAQFDLPDEKEQLSIVAFVKDDFGEKIIKTFHLDNS